MGTPFRLRMGHWSCTVETCNRLSILEMEMKRVCWSVILLLLCGSSTLVAQDAEGLQKALKKLEGSEVSFRGQIAEEQPEGNGGLGGLLGGGGGGVQIEIAGLGSVGNGSAGFEGELEVFVNEEGAVASASTGDLPHIKTYGMGDEKLFSQMHNGPQVDVASVGSLLALTTDFQSLGEEVGHVKVRSKSTSDGWEYRATIDGEYFQPDAGQGNQIQQVLSGMNSKVVEGVLEVVVGADGDVKKMSFELMYNDPMGAMIEEAMKGGGGAQIQGLGDLAAAEDSEGKTVTIEFEFDGSVSETAKAFAEEATELLK